MNRDEAVRYVKDQLAAGMSQDRVVDEMVRLGWSKDDALQLIEVARSTALSGASVTPPVSNAVSENIPISAKSNKKTKLIVSVIAFAILFIGGGVYAYFELMSPNPEDVLRKMMINNFSIDSFSVAIEGKGQNTSLNSRINFNISGDFDLKSTNDLKYSLRIKGGGGDNTSLVVVVDGEVVYRNKIAYLKINPGTSFGPFSLNMISNQWFKLEPQNDLASGLLVSGLNVSVPDNALDITQEQMRTIKEMMKNTFLFKDIRNLSSQDIDGISTYHYGFKPDMAALADLAKNVDGVINNSTSTQLIPQSEIQAIENSYASTTWEIWVGKRDYLLRKLFVTNDDNSIAFTLTMKNYGNVPEMVAPADAKPIEEVFESLFSVSGATGQESANNAKRETDIRQIQTELEMYFSQHDKYPPSLNELVPQYLPKMPVDPSTNQPYQYQVQQNGMDYKMCAQLEGTTTPKCVSSSEF